VPAHEIETAVVAAVRDHLAKSAADDCENTIVEHDLIEQYVERITVQPQSLEIHLFSRSSPEAGQEDNDAQTESQSVPSPILSVPWAATPIEQAKGIVHSPASKPAMSEESRDMLLTAIAKARAWIEDLAEGRAASFAQIAGREGKAERHIRFLAPLAFVSPTFISAVINRTSSTMATLTGLAKTLSVSWAKQGPDQPHVSKRFID
jgi:hypothetical protein